MINLIAMITCGFVTALAIAYAIYLQAMPTGLLAIIIAYGVLCLLNAIIYRNR